MDPFKIIQKYYDPGSSAETILAEHSRLVMKKALELAEHLTFLNPDMTFIREAALLHDIGIFLTYAPVLGCFGDRDYICHGYLGRKLLEDEGLPVHGLVCERHVGVGITEEDIDKQSLPLPKRDMRPVTLEEKIICYADKFYSKKTASPHPEADLADVRKNISAYGPEKVLRFDILHIFFSR
jgi:uncharacterized protein